MQLYDNKKLFFTSLLSFVLLMSFRQGWNDWAISIFARYPLFTIIILGLTIYGIKKLTKDTALLLIVSYISLFFGIIYFQIFDRIGISLFHFDLQYFLDYLIIISAFILFVYNFGLIFKVIGIKKNQICLLINTQTMITFLSLFSIILLTTFKNNWGKGIGVAFMYNRMPLYLFVMILMLYSILYMKKYAVLVFVLTYSIFLLTLFFELHQRLQNVFLFDFRLNAPIQYIKIVVSLLMYIYSIYLMIKIKKVRV